MEQPTTLEAALKRIRELEAAKAPKSNFKLKVSTKGCVSAYGLGRWPVTLYASQWESLLSNADNIKTFIQDNKALLAAKES